MSDPIDPNTGRGRKDEGWKTVAFTNPFAQNQPGQAPPGAEPQHIQPPPPDHGPAPAYGMGTGPGEPRPQHIQPPAPDHGPAPAYGMGTGPGEPRPQHIPPPPPGHGPAPAYPTGNVAGQSVGYPPQAGGGYPSQQPMAGGPAGPGGGYPGYAQPYGQPKKKSKVWLWVLLGLVSLLLLFFVGCVAVLYSIGKSSATTPDKAVKVLHERMKDHDGSAIYSHADPSYKQHVTRAQNDAEFVRISTLLGDPVSYRIMDNRKVDAPGEGDVVDLMVLTTFEKGSANENIELRRQGMEYKLVAYGAESDNLR